MDHRDHGFLPNDRLSINEPVFNLRIDLVVDHLVRQVRHEQLDVAQQLVARVAVGRAGSKKYLVFPTIDDAFLQLTLSTLKIVERLKLTLLCRIRIVSTCARVEPASENLEL